MIESLLESKSDFDKFINIMHDNKLSVEQKVMSEGSDKLDTLMLSYNGRIDSEDLTIIKLAFRSQKVSVGGEHIAVELPEEVHEEQTY